MSPIEFSQRPTISKSSFRCRNPPGASPFASPGIEMMMSGPRQWTVCGADRLVFALISSPSMTLCRRGAFGSAPQSTMWMLELRTPGTIR